jgi:PAS domain-containing protein
MSHLLKILWFLLPLCGTLAVLTARTGIQPPADRVLLTLFAINLLCWGVLTARIFTFRKKLYHFLRLLLAGDYEAGIRTRRLLHDELSTLEDLANRLGERLREYDRLRADRVAVTARALDLTVRNSSELLVTADPEKESLIFNPAAQKQLGISGKSWSFESVFKPEANAAFARLFTRAVSGSKTNTEGSCQLQLPGMEQAVALHVLILPLRDRGETVRFLLITLSDVKPV